MAADWLASPAFVSPGGGAAAAAARARYNEILYLAVPLPDLEISNGVRARTAPWSAIALLSGALGSVGTNASRLLPYPQATVAVVADVVRGTRAGAGDAVLSSSLREVLVSALLPPALRAHVPTPALLLGEIRDGLAYRQSTAGRQSVEESRVHYASTWYCPTSPTLLAHCPSLRPLRILSPSGSQPTCSWAA